MEHYFECALQAAHSGAKGGSIQCAALFAHFADELGLKGGIIYVQNLTKGVAKEAWRDPSQDWLPGDPYRLPCELASDPGVQPSNLRTPTCPCPAGGAAEAAIMPEACMLARFHMLSTAHVMFLCSPQCCRRQSCVVTVPSLLTKETAQIA